ncbi:hypothetical protein ACQ4N7_11275 [Nodosilinea sp. AN01ver1]|uniref:hypothetical protein n=1 Tax=Nodosilinea sp. AN01ver1 TaxID=3423362 RepID=UPI003D3116DA
MRPQDPNFPPEIPPIPPPRDSGGAEDEPTLSPPATGSEAAGEAVDATDGAVVRGDGDAPGELEPIVDYRTSGKARGGPGREPEAQSGVGAASPQENRPDTSNAEPWTDSDLQDVEDPLPVPTPEPEPTYIDRGRRPDPATSGQPPRPIAPAEDVWADTGIPYQPKELGVVDQLLLVLADGVRLWKKGLRWVRSQLPPDLQRQLSDGVLTAIALGLLMLFLALWNPLGAGRGDQVAAEPGTAAEAPASPIEPYFPEEPAVDSGLDSAAEPAPVVEPTPEQNLIADIQSRVSRISRSYGAGLIQSVEVNLPENTLDVNVAEAWYGLLATQQNEIAQDIFAQAQGLNFGTLQLRDPEGLVVARNPVVGPNMVVLHRLRSLDADWRTQ